MLKQVQSMEESNANFEEAKKFARENSNRVPGLVTVSSDSSGAPIPSPTAPPSPAPGASAAPTPAADQSSYLREVLRTPGVGEKQLQATLLRIECDAK